MFGLISSDSSLRRDSLCRLSYEPNTIPSLKDTHSHPNPLLPPPSVSSWSKLQSKGGGLTIMQQHPPYTLPPCLPLLIPRHSHSYTHTPKHTCTLSLPASDSSHINTMLMTPLCFYCLNLLFLLLSERELTHFLVMFIHSGADYR